MILGGRSECVGVQSSPPSLTSASFSRDPSIMTNLIHGADESKNKMSQNGGVHARKRGVKKSDTVASSELFYSLSDEPIVRTFPFSQEGKSVTSTTSTIRSPWLGLAFVAALVVGCSSSGSVADDTVADVTSTSIGAATTSTTTAPTTTTPVPTPSKEVATNEVEQAFADQFRVWRSCTADYDACDPVAAFVDVYTGRASENLIASVVERQGSGRKNTSHEPDPDIQRVDGIEFTNDDLTAATVTYCSIDSRIVSVVNEAGEDEVFDDREFHEQGLAFYVKGDDGVWRLSQFDVILNSSEDRLCDG